MNLEKALKDYKDSMEIIPTESKILETVRKSEAFFYAAEKNRRLDYWEFLWSQFSMIRKRWWLFQLLLLVLLWKILPVVQNGRRVFGVAATLFIILIIPEFWKNKTYQTMEIEAVSYYSLSQIYAARMLLFGIVDIAFISFFCVSAAVTGTVLLSQLLVEFLFPMTVTAAICFGTLSCKYQIGEAVAILLCILWSVVWLVIVWSEKIYSAVTVPVWLFLTMAAIIFWGKAAYKTLHCCKDYLEEKQNGIDFG